MSTTGSDAPSTTNPSGGRKGAADTSDPAKAVTGLANPTAATTSPAGEKDNNAGFGLEHFDKDVKGSLKVHIKLDLDVDIHITARIRGDIAIGLL